MLLTSISSANAKDTIHKYPKELNYDSITLTQRLVDECSIENIADAREFIQKQQTDSKNWIALIDKKIENAETLSGNNTSSTIRNSNVNAANNNKGITLIYESRRAGIAQNFLAAYTIYWSRQKSNSNTIKQSFPIGNETLTAIKKKAFDTQPNLLSICWSPTSFRTNLRMFTTIFRSYLDVNHVELDVALVSFLKYELKFSDDSAKAISNEIRDIENNLSQ